MPKGTGWGSQSLSGVGWSRGLFGLLFVLGGFSGLGFLGFGDEVAPLEDAHFAAVADALAEVDGVLVEGEFVVVGAAADVGVDGGAFDAPDGGEVGADGNAAGKRHGGGAQSGGSSAKCGFSNDWKILSQWLEKMARIFQ